MPSIILSDNGVSSGSAGLKSTAASDGVLVLQTTTSGGTATNAVYVDTSQNVGIGTASPGKKLDVNGEARIVTGLTISPNTSSLYTVDGALSYYASGNAVYLNGTDSGWLALQASGQQKTTIQLFGNAYGSLPNTITFTTNSSERARIDSSGNLLVGTTSAIYSSILSVLTNSTNTVGTFRNSSNSSPQGIIVEYSAASPNGTSNLFINCGDNGGARFKVRSNGGVENYSANNVNLSDVRTKTDIQDAGGYLAKICAIPVRTFKYKDQTDDLLNLGCIAQEVEAVAPELVDASGFGETPEDGVPLKAIYQTDLQYALMKAIQELKAELDTAKEQIAILQGAK